MANFDLTAQTVLLTGRAKVSTTTATNLDTVTVLKPAANGRALDFSSLYLRLSNNGTVTAASVLCTISVSSTYSSKDVGSLAVNLGATGVTYIGGKGFESARFKQASAQSLILTFTWASSSAASGLNVSCEAIQGPYSVTA
jgi:hypothetical protein